jgi:hypothetical protein
MHGLLWVASAVSAFAAVVLYGKTEEIAEIVVDREAPHGAVWVKTAASMDHVYVAAVISFILFLVGCVVFKLDQLRAKPEPEKGSPTDPKTLNDLPWWAKRPRI